MLAAAGVNAPAETPVADSATVSVESAASLITDNAPLVIPVSWGINETMKLTFCPAASVNGVDSPLTLNPEPATLDRKSTRLNSSHGYISYAVFCLKKKTQHFWMCKKYCCTHAA